MAQVAQHLNMPAHVHQTLEQLANSLHSQPAGTPDTTPIPRAGNFPVQQPVQHPGNTLTDTPAPHAGNLDQPLSTAGVQDWIHLGNGIFLHPGTGQIQTMPSIHYYGPSGSGVVQPQSTPQAMPGPNPRSLGY